MQTKTQKGSNIYSISYVNVNYVIPLEAKHLYDLIVKNVPN